MSWSVNGKISEVESLKEQALSQNPECGDQFDTALAAAQAIAASGAVGNSEKEFAVSLAGHANPDHEPRSDWSNDTITVSVSQI